MNVSYTENVLKIDGTTLELRRPIMNAVVIDDVIAVLRDADTGSSRTRTPAAQSGRLRCESPVGRHSGALLMESGSE
jgi:hypothetical protein